MFYARREPSAKPWKTNQEEYTRICCKFTMGDSVLESQPVLLASNSSLVQVIFRINVVCMCMTASFTRKITLSCFYPFLAVSLPPTQLPKSNQFQMDGHISSFHHQNSSPCRILDRHPSVLPCLNKFAFAFLSLLAWFIEHYRLNRIVTTFPLFECIHPLLL